MCSTDSESYLKYEHFGTNIDIFCKKSHFLHFGRLSLGSPINIFTTFSEENFRIKLGLHLIAYRNCIIRIHHIHKKTISENVIKIRF